jgi:hypothetical protein
VLPVSNDPDKVVCSPGEVGSLGGNPSHDSASSRISHPSLGTTTSSRKDKGKGRAVESAPVEQLKGSSGEFSSAQLAFTTTAPSEKKKKAGRRKKTKVHLGAESGLPQNEEPSQTDDIQERHEGMMVHLVRVFGAENPRFAFQFNRSSLLLTVADVL